MSRRRILRAIILGPPGSGKGTISDRIVNDFDVRHLASGHLLRSHVEKETKIGKIAKKYLDAGHLVPCDVTIQLMTSALENLDTPRWLLDGYPRTPYQADHLSGHVSLDTVLSLDVPFETIIERLTHRWTHIPSGRVYHEHFNPPNKQGIDDITGESLVQRADDKEETVRRRLEHYQKLTQPLKHYFRRKNLLQEFRGTESNVIWPHVRQYLSTILDPVKEQQYGEPWRHN